MKAKADLPHGEWGLLFERELVPFGRTTAARLMAIAEHPVLSNVAHVQHLPVVSEASTVLAIRGPLPAEQGCRALDGLAH